MKILYNFASRCRPEKLLNCIENIINFARHDNFIVLLTLDIDDVSVANKEYHNKLLLYGNKVMPVYGLSKNKIDAINKNVWMVNDFDILINMSDDMEWIIHGFDLKIIADMQMFFADTDGFLHYPDGKTRDVLCTMSIMGKKYFDRFGYIYHPDYISVYCDNEAVQVAKILNKYKFIPVQLFSHNHPRWNKAAWDELYKKTEHVDNYKADAETFRKRQAINFGLT